MWRLENARAERVSKEYPSVAPDVAPLPPCCVLPSDGPLDDDAPPDDSESARLLALREAFWIGMECKPCWEVPLGRDLDAMPWLSRRSVGVIEAIEHARRKHGRTALLVDNSPDRVVDTFFLYRPVQVLEAKAMVVEERTGRRSRAQVLEQARQKLVNAMRYGQALYVRMSTTACAFRTTYNGATSLPLAIFDQTAVDTLRTRHSGPMGENLFGSDHPLAGVLREEDTEHGFFTARYGFEVVVSTHLAKDDFSTILQRALPMEMLQPILPRVKERPTPAHDEGEGGAMEEAPAADAAQPEEPKAWTLDDAQLAAERLKQRVELSRARRASGDHVAPRVSSMNSSAAACVAKASKAPQAHGAHGAPSAPLDMHRLHQASRDAAAARADGAAASEGSDAPPTTINGLQPNHPRARAPIVLPDGEDFDSASPACVTRCYASRRDLERDRLDAASLENTPAFGDRGLV